MFEHYEDYFEPNPYHDIERDLQAAFGNVPMRRAGGWVAAQLGAVALYVLAVADEDVPFAPSWRSAPKLVYLVGGTEKGIA